MATSVLTMISQNNQEREEQKMRIIDGFYCSMNDIDYVINTRNSTTATELVLAHQIATNSHLNDYTLTELLADTPTVDIVLISLHLAHVLIGNTRAQIIMYDETIPAYTNELVILEENED